MTTVVVGLLVCVALFAGHRWLGAREEIADLQRTVAALKRQLGRRR